jgi:hypothetical protein
VHRLCGSADKLRHCIPALPHYTLEDTLQWMLAEANAQGVQDE